MSQRSFVCLPLLLLPYCHGFVITGNSNQYGGCNKNWIRCGRIGQTTDGRRKGSALRLNRFLFDLHELEEASSSSIIAATSPSTVVEQGHLNSMVGNETVVAKVVLSKDDYRTIHAAKTLGLQNGDTIRAGIVGSQPEMHDDQPTQDEHDDQRYNLTHGLLTDQAVVQWIPEGKVKKAEPLKNGNPPGSLEITMHDLKEPSKQDGIRVSLILALPRPLQLGRILPMIAQMGVDRLILTQAKKVPKDYFGSHLFRKPTLLRELLVEGLCQAGDVRLPQVTVVKNLRDFLATDMDRLFPLTEYARVVAHPQRLPDSCPLRMKNVQFPNPTTMTTESRKLVLAVGPEGGWEEPDELDRFKARGFQQVTLGTRILRSDVAVVSLLSLANELCAEG